MNLKQLAIKYNNDKASEKHPYVDVYEELFAPIRDNELNLLELGIGDGSSLMMWMNYFPHINHLCGIDKNGRSKIKHLEPLNKFCDIREHRTSTTIDTYIELHEDRDMFDVIIDDCSHWTEHTIFSYFALRDLLNKGGLYIIEDCNYYRAKYTKEILGKYGTIRDCGKDSMIIIRK